jgi:hypothetical protein
MVEILYTEKQDYRIVSKNHIKGEKYYYQVLSIEKILKKITIDNANKLRNIIKQYNGKLYRRETIISFKNEKDAENFLLILKLLRKR